MVNPKNYGIVLGNEEVVQAVSVDISVWFKFYQIGLDLQRAKVYIDPRFPWNHDNRYILVVVFKDHDHTPEQLEKLGADTAVIESTISDPDHVSRQDWQVVYDYATDLMKRTWGEGDPT